MKKTFTTKNIVLIAMFSALALVLHLFDFSIPVIAPEFYKLDLSEIPVLIGSFIMGPLAGVFIEAIKILLKLLVKGTSTAYVGDLANFIIGCAFVVPASLIYKYKKTKMGAFIGMAVAGIAINYWVLIPFYVKAFGMPLDAIIGMGAKINGAISNKFTFVLICVGPFNILKGVIDSLITAVVYKRISSFIKEIGSKK